MEMLDATQHAVMHGKVWNDSPYAVVKGKIGTVEEHELFVHAVLGNETYYLKEILNKVPVVVDDTPSFGYLGGLDRLNEKYATCLAMEIIHACGGIYSVFFLAVLE